MIPNAKAPKNLKVASNILLKNSSLSLEFMFIAADSVQVKLNTLYKLENTFENLFAAEYIPILCYS